jgi:hypothetical protein
MYLTDVLDSLVIDTNPDDVPEEYIREQTIRMRKLLEWGRDLEAVHHQVFPQVPFAPGFLMYLDYLIHINTTGTKQ